MIIEQNGMQKTACWKRNKTIASSIASTKLLFVVSTLREILSYPHNRLFIPSYRVVIHIINSQIKYQILYWY